MMNGLYIIVIQIYYNTTFKYLILFNLNILCGKLFKLDVIFNDFNYY